MLSTQWIHKGFFFYIWQNTFVLAFSESVCSYTHSTLSAHQSKIHKPVKLLGESWKIVYYIILYYFGKKTVSLAHKGIVVQNKPLRKYGLILFRQSYNCVRVTTNIQFICNEKGIWISQHWLCRVIIRCSQAVHRKQRNR